MLHSGTPFFLEHCSRRLFVLFIAANPDVRSQGALLHMPAFGEEMNKSRAVVVAQARALANDGFSVLIPDYSGTGDSSGDFSEASWQVWLEDMRYCLDWLAARCDEPVTLWGLRLGALMALELASEESINISRLVLWNPVLQGEQFMLQFLRLRLVNSMMYGDTKEKVSDLKQYLDQNGSLEVAGYQLSGTMFQQVSALKAKLFVLPSVTEVLWTDVVTTIKPLTVPAQALVDQWRVAGIDVGVKQVEGFQFWGTQEISRADKLIEVTSDWLTGTHSDDAKTLSC
jgi:exosortase A-associated hydrolase 2